MHTHTHTHTITACNKKAPLMSEALLHDSGGEPGEAILFIWIHILGVGRVRRGEERFRWTWESAVGTVTYICCIELFLAKDAVLHRTVCTCSSSHWPQIKISRLLWMRLGLKTLFCLMWPFRLEGNRAATVSNSGHCQEKWALTLYNILNCWGWVMKTMRN